MSGFWEFLSALRSKQAVYRISFCIGLAYVLIVVSASTHSRALAAAKFPAITKPHLVHVAEQIIIHNSEDGVVSFPSPPVGRGVLTLGRGAVTPICVAGEALPMIINSICENPSSVSRWNGWQMIGKYKIAAVCSYSGRRFSVRLDSACKAWDRGCGVANCRLEMRLDYVEVRPFADSQTAFSNLNTALGQSPLFDGSGQHPVSSSPKGIGEISNQNTGNNRKEADVKIDEMDGASSLVDEQSDYKALIFGTFGGGAAGVLGYAASKRIGKMILEINKNNKKKREKNPKWI